MMTMGNRNFMSLPPCAARSGQWQCNASLPLVLATTVAIRDLADLVTFKKQHLGTALASVDLGRQWCGVGELQCDMPFPFGFERRHINNDSAAGIGAFPQTHRQDTARDAKVLDRARQRKRVGRNNADVAGKVDEGLLVKRLGIHNGRVDISEDFEFVGTTHVVAIAAGAVADNFLAVHGTHLTGLERFDHPRVRLLTYPAIIFDSHNPPIISGVHFIASARKATPACTISYVKTSGIPVPGRLQYLR